MAEGIEDHVQLGTLRELGCTLAQGYFWCRPVLPEDFRDAIGMLRSPRANTSMGEDHPDLGDADQRDHLGWAVFHALPTAVAVIGASGKIMATNLAWKRFVSEHGAPAPDGGVWADYLDREPFTFEYAAPEGSQARRYLVLVSPVAFVSGTAIVSHLDITEPQTSFPQAGPSPDGRHTPRLQPGAQRWEAHRGEAVEEPAEHVARHGRDRDHQ